MSFLEEVTSGEDEAYTKSLAASRKELTAGCHLPDGSLSIEELKQRHPHFREVASAGAALGKEIGTVLGTLQAGLEQIRVVEKGHEAQFVQLLDDTARLVAALRESPVPVEGTDVDESREVVRKLCADVVAWCKGGAAGGARRFPALEVVQDFARKRESALDW
jgi:hypothetical protein